MIYALRFVFLPLVFLGLIANFYFRDKVLRGVNVVGLDVSGISSDAVLAIVEERSRIFIGSDILFLVHTPDGGLREVALKASDLGITVNEEKTANNAYSYGRSGNFAQDSRDRINSFINSHNVDTVAVVDFSELSKKIDDITAGDTQPAKNATITFDREAKVIEEKPGMQVDKVKLAQDLRDRVNGTATGPVDVYILPDLPVVSKDKTDKALDKVKRLNNQKIVLAYGVNTWKLSGNTLLSVLRFYPKLMENGYVSKFSIGESALVVKSFGGNLDSELEVSVDDSYIRNYVSEIADSVDQEKIDATLVFEGGKVREFKPAQDGQKLDSDTTFKLIADAVSVENISAEGNLTINLPVSVVRAKIANDEINSLGIKELIGRGVSYFAGSIPNRAYNVGLGASRINGTIVKSGEVFSFNKSVGEVSGATGYKQAYVISSGRTVLDDGGGICQVSTTVFRAALASGLPIVSRTAHAYRVGYYEQRGFKPGMDATVWSPSVDLVFKNDTSHAILVQTLIDNSNAKLEVDIYGTGDGRKVEISTPVVSNFKPAPPDVFQDDPSLPKGTKKQVDFSAQGATSIFGRKVFKGDQILIDETFKSVYRPWQAVFLIGTGG
ncbi:MAG: VanW family protein [Candidatus Curtissbacteria bacterium]|nr:VanW family protein [Candidatus Curtissbacteria bacterium]MDZ4209592.1 VanW family protein [Candidatus Curtissbacteria bacterium]